LQLFYTDATTTTTTTTTTAPVTATLPCISEEKMDEKLDAFFKRINERFNISEHNTATLTITLFMQKIATWMGCPADSVDAQMAELLQFAVKTKQWVCEFLSPIRPAVEKVLLVLGGGDNSIPLSFIALPIASSSVHFILNVYWFRSLAVGDVMLPVAWDHVVNAVAVNLISYLRLVPGFGAIGLTIATIMFGFTLYSVHWKLIRNSIDVWRKNKSEETQAAELDRERTLRNEDISSVKENLSDLWVKTNTTADDVAKVAASCEVQPAPSSKAAQFLGHTSSA